MEEFRYKLGALALLLLLLVSAQASSGVCSGENNGGSDFYFVQLTDTHVMSTAFERTGRSQARLRTALDRLCSFEKKPAFIVITGDLTHWGGSLLSGALNCRAFIDCFYKKDDQLYADPQFTVPVYTTPGNHEYFFARNLKNYHRFIENSDRYVINWTNVSLFFMVSGAPFFGDGSGLYNPDIQWLENALDACKSSTKIVLMHHPAVNRRDENGRMMGVLARNREAFVATCEAHDVDLVLAGHTHRSFVYDASEDSYNDTFSLNCSLYPTLFVQTDDCSDNINYRNISIRGTDVWVETTVRIPFDDEQTVWHIKPLITRGVNVIYVDDS